MIPDIHNSKSSADLDDMYTNPSLGEFLITRCFQVLLKARQRVVGRKQQEDAKRRKEQAREKAASK